MAHSCLLTTLYNSLWPHGLQHIRLPCPSLTVSQSLLKLMSNSWMPSNHLILYCPLLFLSIFASIKVFSNEFFTSGGQRIGASASASVFPKNIQDWFLLKLTGLISLLSNGLSGVFFSTTVWRHQLSDTPPSLQSSFHNHPWTLVQDHSLDYMDLCWQSNVSAFQHCLGLS